MKLNQKQKKFPSRHFQHTFQLSSWGLMRGSSCTESFICIYIAVELKRIHPQQNNCHRQPASKNVSNLTECRPRYLSFKCANIHTYRKTKTIMQASSGLRVKWANKVSFVRAAKRLGRPFFFVDQSRTTTKNLGNIFLMIVETKTSAKH